MKEYDAYLVPTITAGKEVTQNAEIENYYPALVVPKAREIGPQIQGMFERAYKSGVGIAFGTDAGVFKHGENAREFVYMTEAGMPAMEAVQSATFTAAKISPFGALQANIHPLGAQGEMFRSIYRQRDCTQETSSTFADYQLHPDQLAAGDDTPVVDTDCGELKCGQ